MKTHRRLLDVISMATTLAVLVTATTESRAARILYVDAAAPGPNPAAEWRDLSPSGYNFDNHNAVYNAANKSFQMDPGSPFNPNDDSSFVGTGDESIFDFETEKAGAGLGTPFSIVAYVSRTNSGNEDLAHAFVTKFSAFSAPPLGGGWSVFAFDAFTDKVEYTMQRENDNVNRLRARANNVGNAFGKILFTVTNDGSGTKAGTRYYANGLEIPDSIVSSDALGASILNDQPIVLGGLPNQPSWSMKGEMFFVEIHDTVLTRQQVSTRWNNGNPVRAPEPTSLPMLGMGLFGLAGYARRRFDI